MPFPSRQPGVVLAALILATLVAAACGGQPPPAPPRPPVDTQGEAGPAAQAESPAEPAAPPPRPEDYTAPAPRGALARLGRGTVNRLAFSPDGEYVAAGSTIGVHLYTADGLEEVWFLPTEGPVHALGFSPDGRTLAAGRSDSTELHLVDVATAEERVIPSGHGGNQGLCGIAYTPDGRLLATSSYDDTVVVLDAQTGEIRYTVRGSGDVFNTVGFSPDGLTMAVAQDQSSLLMIDASNGELLRRLEGGELDEEGYGGTYGVAFTPDGTRIASGGYGTVSVWDTLSGETLFEFEDLPGHAKNLAFSRDGQRLLAATNLSAGRIWDMETGDLLDSPQANVVATSPTGDAFVTASYRDGLTLWDAASDEALRAIPGHTDGIYSMLYTPDGQTLVSGTFEGHILRWDVGARTASLFNPEANFGPVQGLAVSPDGGRLASGHEDGSVTVWDMASGEPLHRLEAQESPALALAFSPDGGLLASGALEDSDVSVWDVGTGRRAARLARPAGGVYSLEFLSERELLVGTDAEIEVWDVEAKEQTRVLTGHRHRVRDMDLSPDGRLLVSASYDGSAALWDAASGQWLRTLDQTDQFIGSAAFSPDGERVALTYFDGTVRLWDVQSGVLLLTFEGHTDAAWNAVFAPDGSALATGSWDGTIILWDVSED